LPATAYTGTDGQGFTDLENNYYTSLWYIIKLKKEHKCHYIETVH
jgi:hypothetical protein